MFTAGRFNDLLSLDVLCGNILLPSPFPRTGSCGDWLIYRRRDLPIMVEKLIPEVGFGWTMRILAFMILGLMIVGNLTIRSRIPPIAKPVKFMDFVRPFMEGNFALLALGSFLTFLGECLLLSLLFHAIHLPYLTPNRTLPSLHFHHPGCPGARRSQPSGKIPSRNPQRRIHIWTYHPSFLRRQIWPLYCFHRHVPPLVDHNPGALAPRLRYGSSDRFHPDLRILEWCCGEYLA